MKNRIQGMVLGFLAALVLGSLIVPAIAAANYRQITALYDDIKVVVNGEMLDKTDPAYREPFMVGGVTMVPARIIGAMMFDGVTSWDDNTKTLTLGPSAIDAKRTYKLSEIDYTTDSNYIKHSDEARDSTDTFRKDCLLRNMAFFSMDSYVHVDYSLKAQFSRIEGVYFLEYNSKNTTGSCDLKIWGDGNLLYTFEGMTAGTPPIPISLDVKGVEILRIGFEGKDWTPGVGLGDVKLYP